MLRLALAAKPSARRLARPLLRATMASAPPYAPAVPAADKIICLGKK